MFAKVDLLLKKSDFEVDDHLRAGRLQSFHDAQLVAMIDKDPRQTLEEL